MSILGRTGIQVSDLCFGALTIGPLQANMPVEQGAEVIAYAVRRGINFIDTAQLYKTYPYIKRALVKHDVVISSKTYAYTKKMALEAVEQARAELDRDYIDIFMLHEQESIHTLQGHMEALDCLYDLKTKGIIRAVGASMHHIAAVYGTIELGLDVIHPILNFRGLGIVDGSTDEMITAVQAAHDKGIGVFSMKPFGGGNLISHRDEAVLFIRNLTSIDSVAVGMQSIAEVDANIALFSGQPVQDKLLEQLAKQKRRLHIEDWCIGCGECVSACHQKALWVDKQLRVRHEKCLLCGYCSGKCQQFAIKIC